METAEGNVEIMKATTFGIQFFSAGCRQKSSSSHNSFQIKRDAKKLERIEVAA